MFLRIPKAVKQVSLTDRINLTVITRARARPDAAARARQASAQADARAVEGWPLFYRVSCANILASQYTIEYLPQGRPG